MGGGIFVQAIPPPKKVGGNTSPHPPGIYASAVVTYLHKAASYEPRIAILGIWGDTWLTRGKYGIYVAVRG